MRSIASSIVPWLCKVLPYMVCSIILGYIASKLWAMGSFFADSQALFSCPTFVSKLPNWLLVLLLCPFNWLLEAAKWKASMRSISRIPITQALKEVLSGQALNLMVPGSVGHYAGRVAHAENGSLERVGAVFVCQAWQMLVTFIGALLGFGYWGSSILPISKEDALVILLAVLVGGLFVSICILHIRREWVKKIKYGLSKLSLHQFLEIGGLSFTRYLVFSTQFVLMLHIVGAEPVWYELAFAVALVFMAKSLMPSIHFMSDLGMREFCALLFLPSIGVKEDMVLLASLWIWVINILVPSLVGAFMLLHIKLLKSWH